jgi:MEDS: MEthanogen/methylotroph, DcmR Sensory domain
MPDPLFPQKCSPSRQPESCPAHLVQFYEPDFFPARSIAEYVRSGTEAEESSLIVTTPDHTGMIKECLKAGGVEANALERAGLLTCLNAESTKADLLGSGPLCEKSIHDVFGRALMHATKSSPNRRMRVFGEIVSLLAEDGDYDACVELEGHWNRLAAQHSFRLYCSYSLACFVDESSAQTMCDVCDLHSEMVPTIPELHSKSWQAMLLQRSRGWKGEVQTRNAAESALRHWEAEYAGLFDAHVAHWRDCIQQSLLASAPLGRTPSSKFSEKLDGDIGRMVERSLQEIVLACAESCAARRDSPEGSVEWHKRTGEILAYGKLTNVLDKLQRFVRMQARR